jgi:hypothetical protein
MPSSDGSKCFAARAVAKRSTRCDEAFRALMGLRARPFSVRATLKRITVSTIDAVANDRVADHTTLRRSKMLSPPDGLVSIEADSSERRTEKLRLTEPREIRQRTAREVRPPANSPLCTSLSSLARAVG